MKKCIYCGQEINEDAKFCKFCGKSQEVENLYGSGIYEYNNNVAVEGNQKTVEAYTNTYVDTYKAPSGVKSTISYVMVILMTLMSTGILFTPLFICRGNKVNLIDDILKSLPDVFENIQLIFQTNNLNRYRFLSLIFNFCYIGFVIVTAIIVLYSFVKLITAIVKCAKNSTDDKILVNTNSYLIKLFLALFFNIAMLSSIDLKLGVGIIAGIGILVVFLITGMIMYSTNRNKKYVAFSIVGAVISFGLAAMIAAPIANSTSSSHSLLLGMFVSGLSRNEGDIIAIACIYIFMFIVNLCTYTACTSNYKKDKKNTVAMIVSGAFNITGGIALTVIMSIVEDERLIKPSWVIIVFIAVGVVEIGLGILQAYLKEQKEAVNN